MSTSHHVFQAPQLRDIAQRIIAAGGSGAREAELVAYQLVEANLTGHDSHGVGMIPAYVDILQAGHLKPNQHVAIVRDSGALLALDGRHGYGQVIGLETMQLAIERARTHGVCVAALADSHHLGRIGHWAEQCLAQGLVSIHFVNAWSRPIVAPFGGRDARFGTNPFCVGIPRADGEHIVLDFATSRIAQGKTRVAHNKGERLPEGVLLDDHGEPTTDPRFSVVPPYGAILPFGEYKGYGLALVCELLGAALTGGSVVTSREDHHVILNSMLSIVIDADKLGTRDHLLTDIERFVEHVRASPLQAGVERISVPGDPERESRARRTREGIPVDATTWRDIIAAGKKVGAEVASLV